jgi:hypothetical protein
MSGYSPAGAMSLAHGDLKLVDVQLCVSDFDAG